MKKYLFIALLCSSAWAQVAFVGAPTPVGAASAATTSVTYSATNGNIVVLFLGTSLGVISGLSCSDNNSVPLIAGPQTGSGAYGFRAFYYTATGSPTSFSCSWTTNAKSVIGAAEYSGVGSVNLFATNNTKFSSGNPCIVSPLSTASNDYMASACFSPTSSTWTVITGTDRAHLNANVNGVMEVFDNTSGSTPPGSSVTVSATNSQINPTWLAVSIELLPNASSQTNMPVVIY